MSLRSVCVFQKASEKPGVTGNAGADSYSDILPVETVYIIQDKIKKVNHLI